MQSQQFFNSRNRSACRSFLLPCVTAMLMTFHFASRNNRSASPPMMTSSSGCGEKIKTLGAFGVICGRGNCANVPSG